MTLSEQQKTALRAVTAWLKDQDSKQVFRLFGFAGTGKTTLAKFIADSLGLYTLFAAYTGKAALVLSEKGCPASTIHSLIYRPIETPEGIEFVINIESAIFDADLLIIDECSMVNEQLGKDLLWFGTKILVLGDPFQLPPIKGAGCFTDGQPDIMLTEIHRQARDNPIIALASDIRERRRPKLQHYGESRIVRLSDIDSESIMSADQILVGKNTTRRFFNKRYRTIHRFDSPFPLVNDRLVCLKNNGKKNLWNGSLWTVNHASKTTYATKMKIFGYQSKDRSFPTDVNVNDKFFEDGVNTNDLGYKYEDQFDYGYALTVHKSQGSQWNSVAVLDESGVFGEYAARWMYTAITRASHKVTVIIP